MDLTANMRVLLRLERTEGVGLAWARVPSLVGLSRRSRGYHCVPVSIGDEAGFSLLGIQWSPIGSRGRFFCPDLFLAFWIDCRADLQSHRLAAAIGRPYVSGERW